MKQHSIFHYLYILYLFVFLLHILNVFIGSERLNYILGIFAILLLLISFLRASNLFKILGGAFLMIGSCLYFTTEQPVTNIPNLLTSNLSLLTLLMMLPWMNSVVRSGRFDRSLNELMKVNVPDLGKLYPRSSGTTLILTSFLNLSAASISQDVLKDNLSTYHKNLRNSFISTSTLRGFSMALLWSPLEILVAVTIFTTGVGYVSLLPWLLLIAIITFSLDAIWGRYHYKKYPYDFGHQERQLNVKVLIKKIVHLALALIIFLSLVIGLGNLFALDFILTVTILILPFTLIWAFLMKRSYSFWVIGWRNWKEKTNTMQNFVVLFISLSLFSNSLAETNFLEIIEKPLVLILDYPLAILFMIQIVFVLFSMFGVHPIATIGILTGIIIPLLGVMNPLSIAIVLITGSVATITVGTYGLLVTLTSMTLTHSPYKITLRNMPFALTLITIGTIIAYLLL